MLSKQAVQQFQQIYLEEYYRPLSDQEALELASRTLCILKAIYKPIPDVNGERGKDENQSKAAK